MWDPKIKKFVFVDFGFSKCLEGKEKTSTVFFGTVNYCDPDMLKLYMLNSKGFVDLYKNDWHGLKKTFENVLKCQSLLNNSAKIPFF